MRKTPAGGKLLEGKRRWTWRKGHIERMLIYVTRGGLQTDVL